MFKENISLSLAGKIEHKDGLSYLSWAHAHALAGRPTYDHPLFEGKPYRELLGGVMVATDICLQDGVSQRTWLPVLDNRNNPIPVAKVSLRDVTDAMSRGLAKAIAMTTGVGMSLYANLDGDGPRLAALFSGITEGMDDLTGVAAVTEKKRGGNAAAFVPWWAALTAARLADPNFHWEVVEFASVRPGSAAAVISAGALDSSTPALPDTVQMLPYLAIANGGLLAVALTYHGRKHWQWLPVMDNRHGAKTTFDLADWNRTVMRALAKGIALLTGYGLAVYAGEETTPGAGNEAGSVPAESQASSAPAQPAPPASRADPRLVNVPFAELSLAARILGRLDDGAARDAVRDYLNMPSTNLSPGTKQILLGLAADDLVTV